MIFLSPTGKKGFTLLEVIAILVILGIISVVAISRMETGSTQVITARDSLMSHLRLAQMRAMNNAADGDSVWGLRFVTNTQYHIFHCPTAGSCDPSNNASRVPPPGAAAAEIDLSTNLVTFSGIRFPSVIAFNRFGTPFTNAALTTTLSSTMTITLQTPGASSRIVITPQTGRISS